MPFQPAVGDELNIDGATYRIAEHPSAPGMPYGQEGRQAVVYQLLAGEERRALKVFKPRYRLPGLVSLAGRQEEFAALPGLQVCRRTVLSARKHEALLRQDPDLTYAVLMPWIEGPTWMQVLLEKRALTPEQSLDLARSLANVLVAMEERNLAHCDLSGPNVMLPALAGGRGVALVDVEQMYSRNLERPELLPGGSPGYAHSTAPDGLWGATADRFAGAVLLAEMLGWCDERVRESAWGENYFEPQEMQEDRARYAALQGVLGEWWGEGIARLFERAWHSDTLAECATFGEWLVLLPERVPVQTAPLEPTAVAQRTAAAGTAVQGLLDLAAQLEEQGQPDLALSAYRKALAALPAASLLAQEIRRGVGRLERLPQPSRKMGKLPLAKKRVRRAEESGRGTQAGLTAGQPRQPKEVTEGGSPELADVERPELASLFDAALAAYQNSEWAKAAELLAEVVRRQPDYQREGHDAAELLTEVRHCVRGRVAGDRKRADLRQDTREEYEPAGVRLPGGGSGSLPGRCWCC
jgi:hypothetical protein